MSSKSSTAVYFPGMNPQKIKHQVREVSPMRVSKDFMLIKPELFKQEAATRKRKSESKSKSKSKSKGKTVKKRKPKKRRRKTRRGRK